MPITTVANGQSYDDSDINALVGAVQNIAGGHTHGGTAGDGQVVLHEDLLPAAEHDHLEVDIHLDAATGIHGIPAGGYPIGTLNFQVVTVLITGAFTESSTVVVDVDVAEVISISLHMHGLLNWSAGPDHLSVEKVVPFTVGGVTANHITIWGSKAGANEAPRRFCGFVFGREALGGGV